jgi:tRNA C32,U32 (ribose-2'-O)-methylase TrmJ
MNNKVETYNGAFEPEHIEAMAKALDDALSGLGVRDRRDPVSGTVARKIIDRAHHGQLEPEILREQVLQEVRRILVYRTPRS